MNKIKEIWSKILSALSVLSEISAKAVSWILRAADSKKILFAAGGAAVILISVTVILITLNSGGNIPDISLENPTEPETEEPAATSDEPSAGDDFIDDFYYIPEDEADDEDEDENENGIEETTRDPYYNTGPPQIFYSHLTGLRVSRAQQRRRPVSVVMNNLRAAMPMVGISHADIIYEATVEGGITRLMMIVSNYANIPVIGSVRSSREYFIDMAASHDTIYIHAGGSERCYTYFWRNPARNRIDGVNMHFPETFYRDAERRRTMSLEHTMMTSGEGILAGIRRAGYRTAVERDFEPPFKFSEEFTDMGGTDNIANYVQVPFSNAFRPEFIYNPEDSLYYRRQYGEPHIDGATGEQLRFENVIVIFAAYSRYPGATDGSLVCDLTGSGFGFYINAGKYKVIRWSKEDRESPLHLYNRDRSDLYLNPGRTFICVTSAEFNRSVVINENLLPVGE
jgi:hypothetical protein